MIMNRDEFYNIRRGARCLRNKEKLYSNSVYYDCLFRPRGSGTTHILTKWEEFGRKPYPNADKVAMIRCYIRSNAGMAAKYY